MSARLPPRVVAVAAAGGMVGTLARAGVGALAESTAAGTIAVNLIGAAALGILIGLAPWPAGSSWQTFLGTGVLGGFTTYSALALEVAALPSWQGAAYGLATVIGGVAAAAGGIAAGRRAAAGQRERS